MSISAFDYGTKTTNSFDYGTKATNTTGNHTHNVSGNTSTNGTHNHDVYPRENDGTGNAVADSDGGGAWRTSRTSSDGAHSHSFNVTSGASGDHSHTVGIGAHSHTVGIGSHTHNGTVAVSSSEHTHSGDTNSVGGGQAFNIEQPSFVLYVWQRTA